MKTKLPERSQHVAERLADITEVIHELMGDDLAMLILFGSYARGDWVVDRYQEGHITYTYESDFDLLVVTESSVHVTRNREAAITGVIERRLERKRLDRPTSTTVIVANIEHLNKDLERGQYFYSDIKKEGVLLYDNGRHALAEPKPIDPLQRQQYAREDYEHWFTSASRFFRYFDYAFQNRENNEAAFLLHQATERSFHAIVLTFTGHKPRTHDLERLDRQARDLHHEFFKVFPQATEEQKRLFKLLREAYIEARYDPNWKITQEELEYLASRVRMLQEFTKRVCEERIVGMA